ncbi:MAG: SRPBCC family protein [Chitinophagales bacterium]
MITLKSQILIQAPIEKVWALISDFKAIQNWSSRVKKSWLISENDAGIDCERVCKVATLGQLKEVVFVWEEMSSLGYFVRNIPLVKTFKHVWTFTANGENTLQQSNVTVEANMGFLNTFMERKVLMKQLPVEINNLVTEFKYYVEHDKAYDPASKINKGAIEIKALSHSH